MADTAADGKRPIGGINGWNVEVDQNVVEANRSDRIPKGLERHGMVANRQLQLALRDLGALYQRSRRKRICDLVSQTFSLPSQQKADPTVIQLHAVSQ